MNQLIKYFLAFLAYLFLQVFLFSKFTLWGVATPYVFLVFLLMLPLNLPFKGSILVGFGVGLLVDVFSTNALTGLHAFSCVLIMAVRLSWVETITTRIAFRGNEDVFLKGQAFPWYISYLLPLIFLHHLSYFFLEAFGFENLGNTFLKIISSTVFTFVVLLALTLLFYANSEGKSRR